MPRYVVLTRLADSWIPRAFHADPDNAEAEAFRWRRIYGPRRTRIAEYWVSDPPPAPAEARPVEAQPVQARPALPPPITVEAAPVDGGFRTGRETGGRIDGGRVRAAALPRPGAALTWQDAALRAFALYLGYSLVNRMLDLLILLAG